MYKKVIVPCIATLFVLLISSCGKKDDTATVQMGARPTDVQVTELIKSDIQDAFTLPGVVEAWEIVSLSTEVTGHVKAVLKKEGDKVKKGDIILKINTDNAESNMHNKKVIFETAKKDFARANEMFKENTIAEKRFEMAQDVLKLAEVDYNNAVDQYNKSIVISPIDGIIDEVKPNAGEFVLAGQVIATIVQADKLKIYLNIPENDLPYLKIGQMVDVYPANIDKDGVSVKAKINHLSTISDPQTLTYKARIDLDAGNGIRPGKIVRTKILRKEYTDSFIIALYSIVDRDDNKYVFIEDNGTAREIPISIETLTGMNAIVRGMLNSGDRLITSGQHFLSDNMSVKVSE